MSKDKRKQAYQKGLTAEKVAANYMRLKGYKIIEERYKTSYGEIDLIATKDEYLVAIEVKARPTTGDALHAITPRARKRIEQSILYYISQNPDAAQAAIRFDVIAVSPPLTIHHLDNAWQPEA